MEPSSNVKLTPICSETKVRQLRSSDMSSHKILTYFIGIVEGIQSVEIECLSWLSFQLMKGLGSLIPAQNNSHTSDFIPVIELRSPIQHHLYKICYCTSRYYQRFIASIGIITILTCLFYLFLHDPIWWKDCCWKKCWLASLESVWIYIQSSNGRFVIKSLHCSHEVGKIQYVLLLTVYRMFLLTSNRFHLTLFMGL